MLIPRKYGLGNNQSRFKNLDMVYIVFDGKDKDSKDMLKQVLSLLRGNKYGNKLIVVNINKLSHELVGIVKNGAAGVILLFGHSLPSRFTLILIAARLNKVPVRLFYKNRLPIKFMFLNKLKAVYLFREKRVQEFIHRVNNQYGSAPSRDLECSNYFIDVEYNKGVVHLAYYKFGIHKIGRPLLFFLHGVTANCMTYKHILRLLSKHFNVICVDLPGHGGSDEVPVKHLNELGALILKGIKQLYHLYPIGHDNRVIIMGHSLGGAMAFYVGSKLQKYIADRLQLVLLNPVGLPIREHFVRLFLKGILVRAQTLSMYIKRKDIVKSALQDQLLFYVRKAVEGGLIRLGVRRYLDIVPKGLDLADIDSVSVPTLLVFSDKEPFLGVDYRFRFLKLLRCAHYIEVSGGHDWPVINPENINRIIGVLKR